MSESTSPATVPAPTPIVEPAAAAAVPPPPPLPIEPASSGVEMREDVIGTISAHDNPRLSAEEMEVTHVALVNYRDRSGKAGVVFSAINRNCARDLRAEDGAIRAALEQNGLKVVGLYVAPVVYASN